MNTIMAYDKADLDEREGYSKGFSLQRVGLMELRLRYVVEARICSGTVLEARIVNESTNLGML